MCVRQQFRRVIVEEQFGVRVAEAGVAALLGCVWFDVGPVYGSVLSGPDLEEGGFVLCGSAGHSIICSIPNSFFSQCPYSVGA